MINLRLKSQWSRDHNPGYGLLCNQWNVFSELNKGKQESTRIHG